LYDLIPPASKFASSSCLLPNERPATIFLNVIVGEKITKRVLCEICGKDLIDTTESGGSVPLEAFTSSTTEMMLAITTATDARYAKEAYLFVQEGLSKAKEMFSKSGKIGHVSGAQLLEALRELAIEKFGKEAKAKLNGWGLFKCEDFGEIVFNMVESGLLAKQEKDSKADFQGGYNFDVAFPC
jgi:uncharacterized repeat protein (TIGR04138 family)